MAKTIMIVDDSASLRQVVGIALKGAGYEVLEGSDGKDAMGKLDGRKVHLIVSDVNMPNMDGISFVKAAKQLPALRLEQFFQLAVGCLEHLGLQQLALERLILLIGFSKRRARLRLARSIGCLHGVGLPGAYPAWSLDTYPEDPSL